MCTWAALRKCLAAQREKLHGCGWSQPTATSPCRCLSEHWTEAHPWGRQRTPGCIDLWEEREPDFSAHLLPWPATLVQCMSCATVPSGQTLSLPIHLGTLGFTLEPVSLWPPHGNLNLKACTSQTLVLKGWIQMSSRLVLTFKAFYTLLPICFTTHYTPRLPSRQSTLVIAF